MSKSKDKTLKVQPVDIDESKLNVVHHGPWTFPSLHLVIGKIASGKSTWLYNVLTRFWNPVYKENIILFSPTARNDPIMDELIQNDKVFIHFTEYTNEILKRVLEVIKEDENPKSRWLIVFDDCMGQIPSTTSREGKYFNKFICNMRHMPTEGKISVIIAIQKFSSLNNVIRSNAHYIYLMGKSSESELKLMANEMNAISGSSSDKFMELYEKAKEGDHPYHFAMLDFKKLRFMKDFDTLLFDAMNNQDVSQDKQKENNKNIDIDNKEDDEKEE